MTKKLKTFLYKSKADFVSDLDLIWSNCLKYNADPSHPLRRNANCMRREAEKLVPLIPDIVVRPRAEVEAEERRKQNGVEDDAGDESDDEPIMSSRGRKAPGKTGVKGSSKARKVAPGRAESTPGVDQKPVLPLNSVIGNLIHEGSDFGVEGSQNGFGSPTLGGSNTPGGMPGTGSQADMMDIDGPSMNGMALGQALGAAAEDLQEDEEYRVWKQVTKKDRALAAKERHKLFKGDRLNPDEPALLRTKAGMRRWIRQHNVAEGGDAVDSKAADGKEPVKGSETLAEGMEGGDDERVLPDYYDPLSAIPDVPEKLQWIEDASGNLVETSEFLRMIPAGHFRSPQSKLTERMESNMRQMQETRKICSKIGVVKQMQLQTQVSYLSVSYVLQHANPIIDVQQPIPKVQPPALLRGRHRAIRPIRRGPRNVQMGMPSRPPPLRRQTLLPRRFRGATALSPRRHHRHRRGLLHQDRAHIRHLP